MTGNFFGKIFYKCDMFKERVEKVQDVEKRYCTFFVMTRDAKMAAEGTFEPFENRAMTRRFKSHLAYGLVKVHSNYGNFKILVELVLTGPGDDGDFEVRSCPQNAFLVFWDLIPIHLSRDAGTGLHDGGNATLNGGTGALT